MGFGSFIGGIILAIIAVFVAIAGFAVLLGFVNFIPANYDVILGIAIIVAALLMFAYGWYSYQSAKPKGTINVYNQ